MDDRRIEPTGRRKTDFMNNDEVVRAILELQAEAVYRQKTLDTIVEKLDEVNKTLVDAQSHCSSYCTGIFVNKEMLNAYLKPLNQAKNLLYGALFTVAGGFALFLLGVKFGK
jgi:hypothetical protein